LELADVAQEAEDVTTIALGIPHCPWVPAREASMDRLRTELGTGWRGLASPAMGCESSREFTDKQANHEWSLSMWSWGLETGCDFFLTLQDDVEVMPGGFWPAFQAMLAVLPKAAALGLSSVHPGARDVERQSHRWYRTRSWLVGWAYGLWREDLIELLKFRESLGDAVTKITEDALVNRFISETGRATWHPVPTIVDHDTTVDSSYGNDSHLHRRAAVRWEGYKPAELAAPSFWRLQGPEPPPLLESLRAHWTRPKTDAVAQVLICTPLPDKPHPAYNMSVWRLAQLQVQGVAVDQGWELFDAWQWKEDIVRVRSRFVAAFLTTHCTHLLFVGHNVDFSPDLLLGMLRADQDILCAPSPEKSDPIALECCLIKRAALERMVLRYGQDPDLVFLDRIEGQGTARTVALFQLRIIDGELLSDGESFLSRARDCGIETRAYLGPGSPVHIYRDLRLADGARGKIESADPESVSREIDT
jgi:hypothetical protein